MATVDNTLPPRIPDVSPPVTPPETGADERAWTPPPGSYPAAYTPPVNLEFVHTASLRWSRLPPRDNTLQPGDLYLELPVTQGEGARLWVGERPDGTHAGNMTLLAAAPSVPPASVAITTAHADLSPGIVRVSGTVATASTPVDASVWQVLASGAMLQLTADRPATVTGTSWTLDIPIPPGTRTVQGRGRQHTLPGNAVFATGTITVG